MKSLRRSLNKEPPAISTPISTYPVLSKPATQVTQPPNKVIRCVQPYQKKSPQELTCAVGDFLYVVKDSGMGWYEVTNPINNSRGVVPKSCFEELPKQEPTSIQAGPNARLPPRAQSVAGKPTAGSKHQTFYAIVMYDFAAERPDELDAKAGEPISVVAQSNREWFVAKPIGRLGGPGLIPVSFVEIRDPSTGQVVKDLNALMESGRLPRVEEWKQVTAQYKASSIPLGVLDDALVNGSVVADSPFMKHQPGGHPTPPQQYVNPVQSKFNSVGQQPKQPQHDRSQSVTNTSHSRAQSRVDAEAPPRANEPPPRESVADILPPGTVLSANIPSFHYENDEYWFRIDAMYQASSPSARVLQLTLYRNYDDFYEFQISLLDAFPDEAGRAPTRQSQHSDAAMSEDGSTRILPYMPGPVSYVDDMITSVRRTELDQYLNELCELEHKGAGHVLRHDLVRTFLSPKSGDQVDEVEVNDDWVLGTNGKSVPPKSNPLRQSSSERAEAQPRHSQADEVTQEMTHLRLQPAPSSNAARSSAGSGYVEQVRTSHHERQQSVSQHTSGRRTPAESVGRRSESQGGSPRRFPQPPARGRSQDDYSEDSRPSSQAQQHPPYPPASAPGGSGFLPKDQPVQYPSGHSHSYSTASSALSPPLTQTQSYTGISSASSRSARSSANTQADPSQQGGRMSQHQGEGHNDSGAAPAFLKIKIFHSQSDDLIAIRVPPRVTFTQLINKVRDRLGVGVHVLRYRDSYDGATGPGGNNWREIDGDDDLQDWLAKGDKLVLYAD